MVKSDKKIRKLEQWQDMIARLYPEAIVNGEETGQKKVLSRTITFQVTDACNLNCFVAGTKILMGDYTYKNIEDIKVGDVVMGFDEYTKPGVVRELKEASVSKTFYRQDEIIKLTTTTGEELLTTAEHPFLTRSGEWVTVENLSVGDAIVRFTGYRGCKYAYEPTFIKSITKLSSKEPVYNFETSEHTYIANDILVHNCSYCLTGDVLITMADGTTKPIKDVQIGDKILGFEESVEDEIKQKTSSADVEQLFARTDKVIEVEFDNGSYLKITKNHSVLTDGGFVEIGKLDIGDSVFVQTVDSEYVYEKTKIASIKELDEEIDVYNIGTTSRTYIANGIAVHNCYQINKGQRKMSFETAKKLIDLALSGEKGMEEYISTSNSPAVIIEFIGGEPFLEIELMDKIVDYFRSRTIELMHPWATNYCISICSNGVLYFDLRVQKFLNKNKGHMSFSITIDGNKELHDSCRVFHDGRPSYDIAVAGANDWISKGNYMGSKITIAPENLEHVYNAIVHMIELGYQDINANCIYEEGWNQEHAKFFYNELKRVADYFLEKDLVEDVFCSLFQENYFKPKSEEDVQNWCFRAGTAVLTPNGNVAIEKLAIGDKVISGEGNIQEVEKVMTKATNDGITIDAKGLFPTYTTKDHPYWVRKFLGLDSKTDDPIYAEPEWINAQDIKPNDLLKTKVYKFGGAPFRGDIEELSKYDYGYQIPEEVFTWSRGSVLKFVKALLLSNNPINRKGDMRNFATVDPILANDMLLLIRSLGFFPFCFYNKELSLYTLEFDSSHCAINDIDDWVKVNNVYIEEPQYEVYNLTVSNDHTFIANNAIVHNCGGTGLMLACDPDGYLYPCIRYMESSLGESREPLRIGHVDTGIAQKSCERNCLDCLNKIDRRTQSTDECFYCPIGEGCSW